ncbi:LysE family translocator [Nonomuraea salmonea]|uniref:LysE family translocator n=1 Tax=Nonomuraea salmonea TaxID=46181 RepID=UPI002FEC3DE0
MDIATSIWSFAAVVALLTVTPGLDTALILRTSLLAGRRPALGVTLGIQLGTLVWGVLTAAGLSALLAASQVAYDVLRWAGGRRTWCGWGCACCSSGTPGVRWWMGRRCGSGRGCGGGAADEPAQSQGGGAFYVAMLPQFIPDGAPHAVMGLVLAGVHVVEGLVWSAGLIGFASLMSGVLRSARVRRVLDRVTGVVIVGFGVRLAVSE